MPKLIVVGEVNGQLSEIFLKLAKVHAKNNFAFAIIAGNLFADLTTASDEQNQDLHKLVRGQIEVPLPTYFALGNRPLPSAVVEKLSENQGELCPNLFILGRKIQMKTSDGYKIAAIGGAFAPRSADAEMDEYAAQYNDHDMESAKTFGEVDILVTSHWPADVRDGSRVATTYRGEPPVGVRGLAELCTALKPRYHFSTSPACFEREPFFHQGDSPRMVTRFISLAPVNNPNKEKAFFAFSLDPSAPPPQQIPDGCTASPFTSGKRKRQLDSQQDSFNTFRYGGGAADANGGHHYQQDRGSYKKRRPNKGPLRTECFFCLSGREAETHMITSIGEDCYMTIAKGPLSTKGTFPTLNHPMNMLIIPLEHKPTFATIPDESRNKIIKEMQRYRDALHSLVASKSTKGSDDEAELGAVTWEISKSGGVHLHWQFMPVPADMIKKKLVEAAFDVQAENNNYPKFAKTEAEIKTAEEGDYFKAMIWSESVQKDIVMPLPPPEERFDLQFGRRVLGKLLGLEERANWRDCAQPQQEEAADADAFKEMFEQYDFALHEPEEGQDAAE